MLNIRTYDDAAAFYEAVTPFLLGREAENGLMLGLREALVDDPSRYEPPIFLAALESDEEVIGAITRTPPFNLLLTRIEATNTDIRELYRRAAKQLHEIYGELPGVNGPEAMPIHFGQAWQNLTGASHTLRMAQRIYQLESVTMPQGVAGEARPATPDDYDLVVQWLIDFSEEAMGSQREQTRAKRAAERYTHPDENSGAYLWEANGEPVSMAGYAGPTPHGIRVLAVYTPPQFRRNGYASACTAVLSQHLLHAGREFCFLYTDLSNPTSNNIYQRMGYMPVCDVSARSFDEANNDPH